MKPEIIFSILHTSARPEKWREIYDAWVGAALWPNLVQYVLVMDSKFFTLQDALDADEELRATRPQDIVVWNNDPKNCYVQGVNLAATKATGKLFIVNADDQYPCSEWDAQIGTMSTAGITTPPDEFVVEVNTGTPGEHERGIMVMPILSRARYERYGHVFYPEYESMYADNDFFAQAYADGCVIDLRHLPVFPHRHPLIDSSIPMDTAYQRQNRPEAYSHGEALFRARVQTGFQAVNVEARSSRRRVIAVCLPGERFSFIWASAWTHLFGYLQQKYTVAVIFGYSSSVYCTRATMTHNLITSGAEFDFVLWLDDDNILTPQQLEMMIADLDRRQDLSGVVGWCWVQTDGYAIESTVSCGTLNEIGQSHPFLHSELMAGNDDLVDIGWSGFPAVLLRGLDALKSSPHPFCAVQDDRYSWGMAGEDVSFFIRAGRAGLKFAVDRRIEIPHFKMRAVTGVEKAFSGLQVVHKPEPSSAVTGISSAPGFDPSAYPSDEPAYAESSSHSSRVPQDESGVLTR